VKKTSAAAVTSLVAAVLALVPVGVVLGIVALFRIPSRDQRGKRLAVVALSVCAGWTLVAMVAVIGAAAYVGTRHGLITAMRTGVCYNEPDNATGQVDVVGCAGQHDGQIVARPQLDGGHGGYPGDGATMRRSVVDCARAVAAAVPDPGALSPDVVFYAYPPTRDDWGHGIRDSLCVLADATGQPWSGDARSLSGYTSAQLALLRPTSESVLLHRKIAALPPEKWQAGVALAEELVTVDGTEAAFLDRVTTGGMAVRDSAAALASALREEIPAAQQLASASDAGTWSDAERGFTSGWGPWPSYQDLHHAIGL
jgi:hypothetical protein